MSNCGTKKKMYGGGMADSGPYNAVDMAKGGSTVNASGNYTQPGMRKNLFNRIKAGGKGGAPGQWSAERLRCLQSNTKQRAADINNEGSSTQSESLDKAKVAYQEWKAIYSRPESYRGALSTGESYQGSFGQRVCRHYESQAQGNQSRQTVCFTA